MRKNIAHLLSVILLLMTPSLQAQTITSNEGRPQMDETLRFNLSGGFSTITTTGDNLSGTVPGFNLSWGVGAHRWLLSAEVIGSVKKRDRLTHEVWTRHGNIAQTDKVVVCKPLMTVARRLSYDSARTFYVYGGVGAMVIRAEKISDEQSKRGIEQYGMEVGCWYDLPMGKRDRSASPLQSVTALRIKPYVGAYLPHRDLHATFNFGVSLNVALNSFFEFER